MVSSFISKNNWNLNLVCALHTTLVFEEFMLRKGTKKPMDTFHCSSSDGDHEINKGWSS